MAVRLQMYLRRKRTTMEERLKSKGINKASQLREVADRYHLKVTDEDVKQVAVLLRKKPKPKSLPKKKEPELVVHQDAAAEAREQKFSGDYKRSRKRQ